jgi:hypothetical protein
MSYNKTMEMKGALSKQTKAPKTIKDFEPGGIVPGFIYDEHGNTIRTNSGEMIVSMEQQRALFRNESHLGIELLEEREREVNEAHRMRDRDTAEATYNRLVSESESMREEPHQRDDDSDRLLDSFYATHCTGVSAEEAANALQSVGQSARNMGQEVSEEIELEAGDGRLWTISNVEGEDTAVQNIHSEVLYGVMDTFRIPRDEVLRVAAMFESVIRYSPANIDMLNIALREVGPTAVSVGLTLEETLTRLERLFSAGYHGTAGRELMNTLVNSSRAVNEDGLEHISEGDLTEAYLRLANAGVNAREAGELLNSAMMDVARTANRDVDNRQPTDEDELLILERPVETEENTLIEAFRRAARALRNLGNGSL